MPIRRPGCASAGAGPRVAGIMRFLHAGSAWQAYELGTWGAFASGYFSLRQGDPAG